MSNVCNGIDLTRFFLLDSLTFWSDVCTDADHGENIASIPD